ncbi:hypothetical protein BDN72DRAFT_849341 [Pluteus cervinus]|uniref:Uncharacterized protein n=1 Tax=Pluteus cervinus TaxID=181527 RepID=A0ACD3A871_9AGAR|nr:hypothetical protein BDN72DRAFT_849341 [Pluteus cervinus]
MPPGLTGVFVCTSMALSGRSRYAGKGDLESAKDHMLTTLRTWFLSRIASYGRAICILASSSTQRLTSKIIDAPISS